MERYIPLDALVAEIEKRVGFNKALNAYSRADECNAILSFLDTLKVKEADINKEISQFIDANFEKATIGHKLSLRRVAKHFFELGLNVNQDVDLELIVSWFDHIAQIADDRKTANGVVMVDWAALDEIKCLAKESSEFIKTHYKAQKGEKVC